MLDPHTGAYISMQAGGHSTEKDYLLISIHKNPQIEV